MTAIIIKLILPSGMDTLRILHKCVPNHWEPSRYRIGQKLIPFHDLFLQVMLPTGRHGWDGVQSQVRSLALNSRLRPSTSSFFLISGHLFSIHLQKELSSINFSSHEGLISEDLSNPNIKSLSIISLTSRLYLNCGFDRFKGPDAKFPANRPMLIHGVELQVGDYVGLKMARLYLFLPVLQKSKHTERVSSLINLQHI